MSAQRYSRHSELATYRVSLPGRSTSAELWQPRLRSSSTDKTNYVQTQQNERLDTLAYRTLGDAFASWQLADINGVYNPYELLEPGRVIKVPLRHGSKR